MHDDLRLGMFLGGLIMASVPVLFGLGVGVYVLKRHLSDRSAGEPTDPSGS